MYIVELAASKSFRLSVFVATWAAIFLPSFQVYGQLSVDELKLLLEPPNQQKFVKLKTHVVEYTYDDKTSNKLLDYDSMSETTLDLAGGGKIDTHFSSLVQRYASNSSEPSEYTESVVSYIYNGSYWVEMLERKGPKGSLVQRNAAVISESRPAFLGDRGYESGEGFFRTRALLEWRGKRLSLKDCLSSASFPPFTAKRYESEGEHIIEITFQDACTKQRFTFDEDKGCALRSRETLMNLCNSDANQLREVVTITKLKQVDGPLWLPSDATREFFVNDKIKVSQKFELMEYSLLEPGKALFEAQIPLGWHVQDKRYGIAFTVGDNPAAVFEDLKKK